MKTLQILIVLIALLPLGAKAQLLNGDHAEIKRFFTTFDEKNDKFWEHGQIHAILLATAVGEFDLTTGIGEFDPAFVHRAGLAYLTGDDVPQDMKRAAILLGSIHMVHESNFLKYIGAIRKDQVLIRSLWPTLTSEQSQALGHAAYETYLTFPADNGQWSKDASLRAGFLFIARRSDHQAAFIAEAFLYQEDRLNYAKTTAKLLKAANNETHHFSEGSMCTEERLNRTIVPWSLELCKVASNEHVTSKEIANSLDDSYREKLRLEEYERTANSRQLMKMIGLALVNAAKNNASNGSQGDWYEEQRQRGIRARESTWAHVGAAMFVH